MTHTTPTLGRNPHLPNPQNGASHKKATEDLFTKTLAALHSVGAEREGDQGQDSRDHPSTHCWAARSRAASAWVPRRTRRLLRAGCLEGSWKCRRHCSFSRSSSLCFNVSAGNPKQRERDKEPCNSKQASQHLFTPLPASIHRDDVMQMCPACAPNALNARPNTNS